MAQPGHSSRIALPCSWVAISSCGGVSNLFNVTYPQAFHVSNVSGTRQSLANCQGTHTVQSLDWYRACPSGAGNQCVRVSLPGSIHLSLPYPRHMACSETKWIASSGEWAQHWILALVVVSFLFSVLGELQLLALPQLPQKRTSSSKYAAEGELDRPALQVDSSKPQPRSLPFCPEAWPVFIGKVNTST